MPSLLQAALTGLCFPWEGWLQQVLAGSWRGGAEEVEAAQI